MRRQEYAIMETTYEESIKIECTGPADPWPPVIRRATIWFERICTRVTKTPGRLFMN